MTPAGLRAWSGALELLTGQVQEDVARLAVRLEGLLGPVRPRAPVSRGAPDGFRGLVRRGPYDRLLLSEWALLDEVPDEFIRRAIAGEHAFYELDERDPGTGARVRVVLDAGPDQLGAPRIAQMALLFAMERRTRRAGAELVWSVAQAKSPPRTGVDKAGLQAFLSARTTAPFVRPDLEGEPPADELWAVGPLPGPDTVGMRVLSLRERLGPDEEVVVATLHVPGRPAATAELPLPAQAVRTRLLDDPFLEQARPASPPPDASAWRPHPFGEKHPVALHFLPGTQQLAVFYRSGTVALWSLANLGRRGIPKPRQYREGPSQVRLAFGYHQQEPFSVVEDAGHVAIAFNASFRAPLGQPRPTPGNGPAWVAGGSLWFVDGARFLWRLRASDHTLDRAGGGVRAVERLDRETVVLREDGGTCSLLRVTSEGSTPSGLDGASDALLHGCTWNHLHVWARQGDGWRRSDHLGRPVSVTLFAPSIAEAMPIGTRWSWDSETRTPRAPLVHWVPRTGRFLLGAEEICVVPRVPLAPRAFRDGIHVAFHTAMGTVELWNLSTQTPVMLRYLEGP